MTLKRSTASVRTQGVLTIVQVRQVKESAGPNSESCLIQNKFPVKRAVIGRLPCLYQAMQTSI